MADPTEEELAAAKAEREAEQAELKALREEKARAAADKADADAKERAAEKAELEQHRKDKADREAAAAKKVTPPTKVKDKEGAGDGKPEGAGQPKRPRVSAKWFGDQAYD